MKIFDKNKGAKMNGLNEKQFEEFTKRIEELEGQIEFLILPLLYDLTEKLLMPNRIGLCSIILVWIRARFGLEKREQAKKVLINAAEKIALNSPGAWIGEINRFLENAKDKGSK